MTQNAATSAVRTSPLRTLTDRMTLSVFSFALFLSALIMFALEPMTGKMLLPLVGGTPAGWVVAMAFFQIMLLAGYFLAHVLARFSPRNHTLIYIVLLGLGIFLLPPHLAAVQGVGTPGPFAIFILLCKSIALPFIALSAGSSTLQRLFTTARHSKAADPYFLYAASNLGSFAGLLLYPFAIEPYIGLLQQGQRWSLGYALLVGLCTACLFICRNPAPAAPDKPEEINEAAPTLRLKLYWLALAFVPSSLMLGVTTQITADIFSAPMLWVLPLGLYLLTFVIAFSRKPIIPLSTARATQHLFVTVAVALLIMRHGLTWVLVSVHLLCFTFVALACHMQLVALRPADSKKHLTSFYLMMALGGALGGVMNAFLVPLLLNRLLEYPAVLTLSLLLNPLFYRKFDKTDRVCFAVSFVCAVFFGATVSHIISIPEALLNGGLLSAVLIVYFSTTVFNLRATFYGTAFLLLVFEFMVPQKILTMERNFYGVVKVFERPVKIDGKAYTARYMAHGSTMHGVEIMAPALLKHPMAYYSPLSGIGRIFKLYAPKDILVVGLGTGQLNCYNTPQSAMTIVDIDPSVIKVAHQDFNYLKSCTGRVPTKILQGDGRLILNELGGQKFDLIVLDAFSGDGIPVHLLTMEALMQDMSHLKKGGMIAINISNRYFNLEPVLNATADFLGMETRVTLHLTRNLTYDFPSLWLAMAPKGDTLDKLDSDTKAIWANMPRAPGQRIWTDDYSSLLDALKISIPFIHKEKTLKHAVLP